MNSIRSYSHRNRSLLVLHSTVLVWGFTGILGSLISIPATHLVWYRVLIALITLYIWIIYSKTNYKISQKSLIKLVFSGAIVAAHWILFFYSIKASTVSVTLVCLSSLTLFTAILEPLFNKARIALLEIFIGLFIISGIGLIFKFEGEYTLGIITGLCSALCASLFSIINSKLIKIHQATIISFYELLGAWCWISLYLLLTDNSNFPIKISEIDLFYLIILGTICTSVAYVAGVSVMKDLSAFRVALITNLEPIYGVILALIFFGNREKMSLEFYIGSVIILGSVFLYPILKNRSIKQKRIK